MSFTYDWTNFPQLSRLRMMVGDTQGSPAPFPIWQDDEINGALGGYGAQNFIVGLSGYSPVIPPPPSTYSYGLAAALLLNSLSAVKARTLVESILAVTMDGQSAAKALQALGQTYIDQEANNGFFAVAEMGDTQFWFRERLYKMLYRQNC